MAKQRDRTGAAAERTGNAEAIAGLRHQTPWPCRVEEGRRVVDLDAGVGSEVKLKLRVGLGCESQEDDEEEPHGSLTAHSGDTETSRGGGECKNCSCLFLT